MIRIATRFSRTLRSCRTYATRQTIARSAAASFLRRLETSNPKHSTPVSIREVKLSQDAAAVAPATHHDCRLVIFDQDGTLFDCKDMWNSWAKAIGLRLEQAFGCALKQQFYDHMGFDALSNTITGQSPLATRPWNDIYDCLALMIANETSATRNEALEMVMAWSMEIRRCEMQQPITDLACLFTKLKAMDIKIAITSNDDRTNTEALLQQAGIGDSVDLVVTNSDNTAPKPHAEVAHFICSALAIEPSQVVVVGDTPSDMLLGKNAEIGLTVGVLSGAGNQEDLTRHSDVIIDDVDQLISIIQPPTA